MKRMTPEVARLAIGVQEDGKLSSCPGLPNCVVSQYPDDRQHHLDAFDYQGEPKDALERLLAIVSHLPRTTVMTKSAEYLHVEFKSGLMGFVDDVEFLLDDSAKKVHFRSASRLGLSDLGANKKRMAKIRRAFART